MLHAAWPSLCDRRRAWKRHLHLEKLALQLLAQLPAGFLLLLQLRLGFRELNLQLLCVACRCSGRQLVKPPLPAITHA